MSANSDEIREYRREERPFVLRASLWLRAFVDQVGKLASWLIVPLVLITCLDVVARKMIWRSADGTEVYGLQIWLVNNVSQMFGSTLLQELEWHLHTGLFALVLGYGYIYNTHVRVDLVRETLSFRKRAWIEFIGITIFMLPFCLIATYFAIVYAYDSWAVNEISASTVGLTHRWIIKSVLAFGFIVAAVSGFAVWLQMVVALFGNPNRRFDLMAVEWPEQSGQTIEGKRRIEIDDDVPAFETSDATAKDDGAPIGSAQRQPAE
ncbi:MAG: TRAP transporter small permease subunit [Pseudomonadota bacterium]